MLRKNETEEPLTFPDISYEHMLSLPRNPETLKRELGQLHDVQRADYTRTVSTCDKSNVRRGRMAERHFEGRAAC